MGLHRNGFNYSSHALVASRKCYQQAAVEVRTDVRRARLLKSGRKAIEREERRTPTPPPTRTRSAPFRNRQEGRLRPEISRRVLTEGQRDTVLRMNGRVMLSM